MHEGWQPVHQHLELLRLERVLSADELGLFDYPQNAWGGENLFLFLVTLLLRFVLFHLFGIRVCQQAVGEAR